MAATIQTLSTARPARANLQRFVMLLQTNFVMYIREKSALFWVIFFPIGMMLIFGAIYGNERIDPRDPTLTAISFIAPGLIVLSLMSNGLVGNASTMASWREKGVLARVQTTPLPVWQLLLSRIIMQSVIMVGQAALMLGTSVVVFNARYDWAGVLAATPAVIIGAVLFMAMGQAVAAVVSKVTTVEVVAQVINFPLMFLGGLWQPIDALPDWLESISRYLPSTLVADLVRTPMLSTWGVEPSLPMWMGLLGVAIYFAVSVFIGARFFKWK